MKTCIKCNKELDESNFYTKGGKNKDKGYQSKCKICFNSNTKEYYTQNKIQLSEKQKNNYSIDKEKYLKRIKQYSKSELGKKTIQKYYQIHRTELNKKVKNNNKNRYKTDLEYNKYIKNKAKEWEQSNKIKKNERQKNRYKTDTIFRLKLLLRNRLNQALCGNMKLTTTLKLLGCTIEEFKLYLEQQFKPEMTWENHGEIWEIDHIKPCASFNLIDSKQQQECFNYKNTQPLFKTTEIAVSFGYINEIGNRDKSIN
jgi:hypothetical protein